MSMSDNRLAVANQTRTWRPLRRLMAPCDMRALKPFALSCNKVSTTWCKFVPTGLMPHTEMDEPVTKRRKYSAVQEPWTCDDCGKIFNDKKSCT